MQRLSGLDAMFFYIETPSAHMHVTGVYVLEPGKDGLSFGSVRDLVSRRLPLAGVLRRRIVEVPLRLYHPVWVEDPGFDLDYHLRRAALPAPGGMHELQDLVSELTSLPLDRRRPLWEMYVVEGLESGRVAVVGKMHHAAIDGISGAETMATLFDLEPHPPRIPIPDPWRPEAIPTEAELLAVAMAALVGHPMRAARTALRIAESVLNVSEHNGQPGVTPPPSPFSAPKTRINQALTPDRGVAFAEMSLDDLKVVRRWFACTVNDVVLGACAGALRAYLSGTGDLPAEPLVALVPVSVRAGDGKDPLGNRLSAMLTSLGTELPDPGERLVAIAAGMRAAKDQERLIGAEALTGWTELALPGLIGRAARLVSSTRVFDHLRPAFNLTISNVPGPPVPLFFAGSRLVAVYPLGPLAEGAGLNITVMSYCGRAFFGLSACKETVPCLSELAMLLDDSLAELLALCGGSGRPSARASPRTASASARRWHSPGDRRLPR
ncbi:MAG: WS/DGAT/MGAT family O-acyltransferase [Acidimicrobiales bacterium]